MDKIDAVKKKMLEKKKWVVVGVTEDKTRYGYKIFKKLKETGYTVYGINPKYSEIDGDKIYSSIKEIPEKVECVNMLVNPKISLKILEDIVDEGIKYVWFQPGSFNEETIDKAEELGLNIVFYDCLYVELGR
ncbi:CoA-binding protein [Tepidibacter formicigenes]|jgi:predicted CoA-binding protein|uniref:CoA-binding domain-containing protein n=1 Tax=Tepidibacter formicigenes DSM 15518 TaxID=1123349 RepID=A0A1M6RY04_9FIRM|nr:CoA-binding protein [Tepidibacter formicigenes]SHK37374.1 hypothetical protein SAMN02744037_02213 [Tepidibacter formicigenes DSM 15518]